MTTTEILGKMREDTQDPPRLIATIKRQGLNNTEEITTFAQLQSFIKHYRERLDDTIELRWNFLNGQDQFVVVFDCRHCRIDETALQVDQCSVEFARRTSERQKCTPLSIGNVVINSGNLRRPENISVRYRPPLEMPTLQPTA